jgi:hypothetical protein
MAILTPAQEARVKAHREENESDRRALDQDYMVFFASPIGQKVLEDLRRKSFLTKTTVVADATGRVDERQTLLNEGSRMTILYIENRIARATRGE